MRTIGILLLSLLPVIWGIDYNLTQKRRVVFLENFTLFIVFIREQIRFSASEILEIFSLALRDPSFTNPIYEELFLGMKRNQNLEKIFKNNNDIRLKDAEINLVCSFLNGLGKNDIEGQKAHADYYKENIGQLAKKVQKETETKSKLVTSLCVCLAAALFVLII